MNFRLYIIIITNFCVFHFIKLCKNCERNTPVAYRAKPLYTLYYLASLALHLVYLTLTYFRTLSVSQRESWQPIWNIAFHSNY